MRKLMNWIRFVVLLAIWGQAWGQVADVSNEPLARVIVKFKVDGIIWLQYQGLSRFEF